MSKWLWKITRTLLTELIGGLELVIDDFFFGKRSRKRRYPRPAAPKVIIVKVPR